MVAPFSKSLTIWYMNLEEKGRLNLTHDTITGWGMPLSSSGWRTGKGRKKEPPILNPERSKHSKSFLPILWSELITGLYPNAGQPGKCSVVSDWMAVIPDGCGHTAVPSSCPVFLGKHARAFFAPEHTLREVLIPYGAVRVWTSPSLGIPLGVDPTTAGISMQSSVYICLWFCSFRV